MAEPGPYGRAQEQARALLAQARLDDPGEHFPYKHDVVSALLDEDPAMGPGVPGRVDGAQDRSRLVEDFMTPAIADASKVYIDAQAGYLAEPASVEASDAYEAARDRLVAARLDHRQSRGGGFTIGAAARRAG